MQRPQKKSNRREISETRESEEREEEIVGGCLQATIKEISRPEQLGSKDPAFLDCSPLLGAIEIVDNELIMTLYRH